MSPSTSKDAFAGGVRRKVAVFRSADRTGITPREDGRTRADEIVPDLFVIETSTGAEASNDARVARDLECRSTVTATALIGCHAFPGTRACTVKSALSACVGTLYASIPVAADLWKVWLPAPGVQPIARATAN